jgi:hypothetical protein
MTRSRLTHDDAMTLWRARDVYCVQAVLRGLVLLFFALEFCGYCTIGYWYFGVLTIALQWALWRCLCWALRWAQRGLWWSLDRGQVAVLHWGHERRRDR